MDIAMLSQKSLVELKQLAKGRRIKQYYILKRHDLIRILSLPELPPAMVLEKLTIHTLRDQAKAKGLKGFWTLHRQELLDLLYPTPGSLEQQNQDRTNPQKHQQPQRCDPHQKGHE
jgi:hypothetical protein